MIANARRRETHHGAKMDRLFTFYLAKQCISSFNLTIIFLTKNIKIIVKDPSGERKDKNCSGFSVKKFANIGQICKNVLQKFVKIVWKLISVEFEAAGISD